MSNASIEITVTVEETADGSGNVGNGGYLYTFQPESVHVTQSNTQLIYQLATQCQQRYRIVGFYSTDSRFQLMQPTVAPDGLSVSVLNINTQPQLMYVAVQVVDLLKNARLSCDPQVTNDPPSEPTMP